jgi:predicted ATPase/class 3 adenylate cyclase/Tfp pilus assembly protein PilF
MGEPHAVLFADIVDSTLLSRRIGDNAMADVWQSHNRAARDLLRKWRGREIDQSDGFLLLFTDASDAVDFALGYHDALGALPVPVKARVGLHVGPITLHANSNEDVALGAKPLEVEGLAKAMAARVMSLAQGGQTLLTASALQSLSRPVQQFESHGHWRVKGIDDPIELFEVAAVGATLAPPPDSEKGYRVVGSDGTWVPVRALRHSLPAERDSFIGRQTDLHDLDTMLRRSARSVTVLGVGGTGKTRFVQHFGWTRLGEFPGGVWFCDLSQARSLDGICSAVAQGLQITLGQADPVSQLGSAIKGRGDCLVILDNFEQVARHAEDTLGRWLESAPSAHFLVTSRESLAIVGEASFPLGTLGLRDGAELFRQRAAAALPSFEGAAGDDEAAVELLVNLLDGLPLAIELAAARVTVFSLRDLVGRMSERFALLVSKGARRDRQATLRATFDWSWDLMSDSERSALAQLSVFCGSWTLEAAGSVLAFGDLDDAPAAADVVESLVKKSLVRHRADGRFDLLVSLREYAAEHLQTRGRFPGSGPAAVTSATARHVAFFASLGPDRAVAEGCANLDDMIAACRHAVAAGDARHALGALEGAWAALRLRGPFGTAVALAGTVDAMTEADPGWRARVNWLRGLALRAAGKMAEARASLEAALTGARVAGDRHTECRAQSHLGELHLMAGQMTEAQAELMGALALARQTGDRTMECEALGALGELFERLGQWPVARSHDEQALAIAREIGDRRREGGALGNLGVLYADQGHPLEAREYCEAGLAIAREVGDRQWEGNALCNLGLLHQESGRLTEARETLDRALAVARDMGYTRLSAVVMCNLGILDEAMHDQHSARRHYEAALATARELGDRRSEGQFLGYLGALNARQGRFDEAWDCLGAGEQLLTAVSDRFSLGVLWCNRAEAHHLTGDSAAASAQLARARSLAHDMGAQAESELGLSLARVDTLLFGGASA